MTDTAAAAGIASGTLCATAFYEELDGVMASARDFTASFLNTAEGGGRIASAKGLVDTARLVVSELVTNVVRHAPGPFRVELELTDDSLEISVTDSYTSALRPHDRDPERIGRHGLEIVLALCERVDVEPIPSGKRVRARIART